ncbi:DUF2490 domain-containing protein [Galbibacter pacificus]|uniref:DUF2490 domain-containing protein n=1 Tax=Galbibacter pacificus TaxID=2996052 RepID=A0ABT6FPI1_9FLAO|nr:DUF2490 domain-containing protein [Galbibacter pacificus]MDG3582379.1 DUF2490 domain-containing protein [Galbibacter pacificus]MDG3585145.1 DUF2490 domain-containing protein [Galbibacter pacificus]
MKLIIPTFVSKTFISVGFIFLMGNFLCAQENDSIYDHDITKQAWFTFQPGWQISERVKLNTEIGYRTVSPKSWNRFNTKAELSYALDEFNLRKFIFDQRLVSGVGYYYIHNFNDIDAFELRIYQGYKIGFNLTNRIDFLHYFRLEERFTNPFRDDGSSFGLRLRYKITGNINLEGLFVSKGRGFYIPIDVEFFFNIKSSKQINDIIRLSPGVGYVVDPTFKIQFNISYHYTKQEFEELVRTNDIIFRLRVYKTFKLKKDKKPGTL